MQSHLLWYRDKDAVGGKPIGELNLVADVEEVRLNSSSTSPSPPPFFFVCLLAIQRPPHTAPSSAHLPPSAPLSAAQIVIDAAQLRSLTWPSVEGKAGVRFALATKAETLFPLFFEEKGVGKRWLRELRRALQPEEASDAGAEGVALAALDESMVALEDARELLLRLEVTRPNGEETKAQQALIDTDVAEGFYLVLENLTTTFSRPCILDLKLGERVGAR